MSGAVERGHAQIFKRHVTDRGPTLIGSPGAHNEARSHRYDLPEFTEDETGAAGDKRIAAATKAGHLITSESLPDEILGPEIYHG